MDFRLNEWFLLYLCYAFGEISAKFQYEQGERYTMQKSVSNCILSIAKTNFRAESIIGIISSNFHNTTNKQLAFNSYNVIVADVMKEMRWNIIIKDGNHFNGERQVI